VEELDFLVLAFVAHCLTQDLDASEVENRKVHTLKVQTISTKRVFLRRQTTALLFPTVPVYTDATIDSWSLSEFDEVGIIKRVGTDIKMVTMPKFISILTASGDIGAPTLRLF
jgi:hypothetical protein